MRQTLETENGCGGVSSDFCLPGFKKNYILLVMNTGLNKGESCTFVITPTSSNIGCFKKLLR